MSFTGQEQVKLTFQDTWYGMISSHIHYSKLFTLCVLIDNLDLRYFIVILHTLIYSECYVTMSNVVSVSLWVPLDTRPPHNKFILMQPSVSSESCRRQNYSYSVWCKWIIQTVFLWESTCSSQWECRHFDWFSVRLQFVVWLPELFIKPRIHQSLCPS